MEKCVNLLRFSTHNGNSPDSRLFASNNLSMVEISPSSDGIDPVRLLPLRYSCVRLESCPSSGGIGPLRLLPLRCSCVRLESCPSSGGIDPWRLLLVTISCVRLESCPSSGGSVPFSGGETGPGIHNSVTRWGVPPKEILVQLCIAVDAFQLRVAVPRRVSFSPQRTLQSAMRSVFV